MNLAFFAILIVFFIGAAWRWRPLLLTVWVISFMIFPAARLKLGSIPVYGFDITMVAVLGLLRARGELAVWPAGVPRWHWWLVGVAFVFSVVFGAVQYGPVPELLWIWGHTALAWMGFAIGVAITLATGRREYSRALQAGFLISAVVLCVIAVTQYLDLPGTSAITQFFYGSLGAEESVEVLRVGAVTNRANGPHFAPTAFAGIVLLAAVVFWLISDGTERLRRAAMLGLSGVTILCTVSRHVPLAALLGAAVTFCFSDGRTRLKMAGAAGALALLLAISAGSAMVQGSWDARLSRFDDGVLEDDNIAARVIWGPARLVDFFERHPLMLWTGAGIDPEKLMSRSGLTEDFEGGFVSNGFLLALYYLGIGGFVLYTGFWVWALRAAAAATLEVRGVLLGAVTMAIVIVAADNYSLMYEPVSALLFLIVGLVATRSEADAAEEMEPAPEEAYA